MTKIEDIIRKNTEDILGVPVVNYKDVIEDVIDEVHFITVVMGVDNIDVIKKDMGYE